MPIASTRSLHATSHVAVALTGGTTSGPHGDVSRLLSVHVRQVGRMRMKLLNDGHGFSYSFNLRFIPSLVGQAVN